MIVGIGASAGGLQAFREFFSHMPADTPLAFVLVQHLAPDHVSVLAELLARVTDMPVIEAEDDMQVERHHVYVIPPNATLTIANGSLQVLSPAPPREQRRPINTFFTSLAEDQGNGCACVVLSGAGSDGTEGLAAIKNHGGLVLVQSGSDHVALDGMPASAAATGLVDSVLPVADMPAELIAYQRRMQLSPQRTDSVAEPAHLDKQLRKICELLRDETGHDFSQYKPNTLMRRIQRRVLAVHVDNESDYVDYLHDHPQERELLFREFLIGVTEFFRDPAALDTLASAALPTILKGKGEDDQVRVWVPGCASGEEAYTIAILLSEQLEQMPQNQRPSVQVFATDIDDRALEVARAGCYRLPQRGISKERRERWFSTDDDTCCVVKQIRDMCIFSTHNVASAPPFPRMDLVSCRNLLIYLNADLQRRLMQSFHYALCSGGFLLLGSSERLIQDSSLFKEVDRKQRLYTRCDDVSTYPQTTQDSQKPMARQGAHQTSALARASAEERLDRQARQTLEPYSPAYVIINADHDVLRFGGDIGRFLGPSTGAASLGLFQILERSLRGVVRDAVLQVFANGTSVVRSGLTVPGQDRPMRVIVEPLNPLNDDATLCVVAFSEVEYVRRPVEDAVSVEPGSEGARISQLEDELRSTREQLDIALDMHERATDELRSADTEYQTLNEELQSANEELETSNEEMQAINEELQTVNVELNSKNEELNLVNDDIRNLLDSTRIAAVFLDAQLRIRSFTPAMTDVFHLREGDKGRPLQEISALISYPQLQHDVSRVLEVMKVSERVLHGINGGSTFLMRMRPYVTVNDAVDGVVLTFFDITHTRRRDREARRLAAYVNSAIDAIVGLSLDDRITSWNPSAERFFGVSAEQAIGQPLSMLRPDDTTDAAKSFFDAAIPEQRLSAAFKMVSLRARGGSMPLEVTYSPVLDNEGRRFAGKLVARDITERQRAEKHTAMMMGELNHRVKNTLASVQAIAEQTLYKSTSLDAFRESFLSRLLALSQTHNLLAKAAWNGAALAAIISNELAPYQRDDEYARVILSGAEIMLTPKQALALSMGIHELATNAGKYGALSVPGGQVTVQWSKRTVGGKKQLHLRWVETGGPVVSPPQKPGFGSRLISEGLAYELDGEVSLEFPAGGVTCRIDIPLA